MLEKIKERIGATEVNTLSWEDLKYYTEISMLILKHEEDEIYREELKKLLYRSQECLNSLPVKKEEE